MSTLYIVSDGGKLIKKGGVLQLKKDNDILNTVFPFKTEQLFIIGRIEITSAAISFLMKHRIETVFLGKNGRYNGKILFQTGKNIFLRQKQYKLLEDNEFKLKIAKSIVLAKLHNQLSFMQRIIRKVSQKGLKPVLNQMKANISKAETTDNLDSLRGYEGNGARLYFSIYKFAVDTNWARFNGRSMHPPRDNVNAVLSFLYTMILYRVDAAIETEGIDSYAGYFHSLNYGKKSLVYDLMEEYRTPIADTLTAALFNLGILKEEDFREEIFSKKSDDLPLAEGEESIEEDIVITAEKKGVLLTKDGIKKVLVQLEKKLDDAIYHGHLMKRLTYKQLINEQVKHFKRVLIGQEMEYKPLRIK